MNRYLYLVMVKFVLECVRVRGLFLREMQVYGIKHNFM